MEVAWDSVLLEIVVVPLPDYRLLGAQLSKSLELLSWDQDF